MGPFGRHAHLLWPATTCEVGEYKLQLPIHLDAVVEVRHRWRSILERYNIIGGEACPLTPQRNEGVMSTYLKSSTFSSGSFGSILISMHRDIVPRSSARATPAKTFGPNTSNKYT
jgi:hypothetical protein